MAAVSDDRGVRVADKDEAEGEVADAGQMMGGEVLIMRFGDGKGKEEMVSAVQNGSAY